MCAAATFENRALYVHIPFCQGICAYCDFTRVRYHTGLADQYLKQLARELEERVPCQGMETVYIGGGTPTALSPDQLRRLLDLLQPYLQGASEVTIEANPEAINAELIEILLKGGINRISLGLQSCDDEILKQIGRRHTFAQARQAVRQLQQAGLTNISCDLIYSLPRQTRAQWKKTLQDVLSLNIPHCSLYALTIEEHSEFGRTGQRPLDEDTEASMYFEAVRVLTEAGYQHYEISNFAKPGYASRHNLHYWNYDDFYGVGLGASGKLSSFRYDNTRNFQEYFKGHWIGETIELSRRDQMFERVMMNLRTARGLSLAGFEQKFGLPLSEVYPDAVQKGIRQGWLRMTEDRLAPTEAGMALLNTVLEEFLD